MESEDEFEDFEYDLMRESVESQREKLTSLPSYITAIFMRNWVMARRPFYGESGDRIQVIEPGLVELDEKAKMRELVDELQNILSEMQAHECRLSELFGRKITVEDLDAFLQKIRSAESQDVRNCLSPALIGLPIVATGHTKKPREVVQRYLAKLSIPFCNLGLVKKAVAATCEVYILFVRVVSIFRFQSGKCSRHVLTSLTGVMARDSMAAVLRCFRERAKTFNLLGFNSTFFQLKPGVQAVVTYLGKVYQSKMAAAYKYQLPLADDYSSDLEDFSGKIEAPIIVEEVPGGLQEKVVDCEQKRSLNRHFSGHRPVLCKRLYKELTAAANNLNNVPEELLVKRCEENGSLAAISESLSLAIVPPKAIQLVATGHITDVHAENALVKAEAKELVMDSLKTAACKVVEDVIAAAVGMVHKTTPLVTQISQIEKAAFVAEKTEIASQDVLNVLLDKVVNESEKRRSLITVSDCSLMASQLPQLTDLGPEQCSGETAKCAADEDRQVKKKKKKRVRAFFKGLWKRMICSSGILKED